jgi:hypothetical protein
LGNLQDTAYGGAVCCGSDSYGTIIRAPAGFPGTKAMQFAVYGDSVRPAGSSSTRVRVQVNADPSAPYANGQEGQAAWYEWWSEFPSDPALNNGPWTGGSNAVVQQWGAGYAPNIVAQDFGSGPILELQTYTGSMTTPKGDLKVNLGSLRYDHPYHFQEFIRFSQSKSTGQIGMIVDGQTVLPVQAAQTLPTGVTSEKFALDMYRNDNHTQNGGLGYNTTVIHSGVTRYAIP